MTNSPTEKTVPPRIVETQKPPAESPTLAGEPGAFLLDDPEVARQRDYDERELYGGGHITAPIPKWLLVVYAVMILWGLYYAVTYWGGLGPGLDYSIGSLGPMTGRALG
jgi:hypothetical protein